MAKKPLQDQNEELNQDGLTPGDVLNQENGDGLTPPPASNPGDGLTPPPATPTEPATPAEPTVESKIAGTEQKSDDELLEGMQNTQPGAGTGTTGDPAPDGITGDPTGTGTTGDPMGETHHFDNGGDTPARTTSGSSSQDSTKSTLSDAEKQEIKDAKQLSAQITLGHRERLGKAPENVAERRTGEVRRKISQESQILAYVTEKGYKMDFVLGGHTVKGGVWASLDESEKKKLNLAWKNGSVEQILADKAGDKKKDVRIPLLDIKFKFTSPSSPKGFYVQTPTELIRNLANVRKADAAIDNNTSGEIHLETLDSVDADIAASNLTKTKTIQCYNKDELQSFLLTQAANYVCEAPSMTKTNPNPRKGDGTRENKLRAAQAEYTAGQPGIFVARQVKSTKARSEAIKKDSNRNKDIGENFTRQDIKRIQEAQGNSATGKSTLNAIVAENYETHIDIKNTGRPRHLALLWENNQLKTNFIAINKPELQSWTDFMNTLKAAIAGGEVEQKKFTRMYFRFNFKIPVTYYKQQVKSNTSTVKYVKDNNHTGETVTGINAMSAKLQELLGKEVTTPESLKFSPIADCCKDLTIAEKLNEYATSGEMDSYASDVFTPEGDRVLISLTDSATSMAFKPVKKNYKSYEIKNKSLDTCTAQEIAEEAIKKQKDALQGWEEKKKTFLAKEGNAGKEYKRPKPVFFEDLIANGAVTEAVLTLNREGYKEIPPEVAAVFVNHGGVAKTAEEVLNDWSHVKSGKKISTSAKQYTTGILPVNILLEGSAAEQNAAILSSFEDSIMAV